MTHSYSIGDEPVAGSGYRLTGFLGRGGFGEVWKATGPGGTEVALKIIRLGGIEGRKEFRALQLVKRVRHPNLVPTIAFWVRDAGGTILDENLVAQLDLQASQMDVESLSSTAVAPPKPQAQPVELIIAMGLGDTSLHDRLQECREQGLTGIPPDELLCYMEGTAAAIDYLNRTHDLGAGPVAIQHCDIKPQNIMIVGGSAQVCDFGLARTIGATRMTTAMAATVAYAAPEFLQTGKPSGTSDQYSLALTYYELRTGHLPYPDETYGAVMAAVVQGRLELSGLTEREEAVLRRATDLDPEARYTSAAEMIRDLRAAHENVAEAAADSPTTPPPRRGGVLAAFLLALLAAGLGYAGWRFWPFAASEVVDQADLQLPRPEQRDDRPDEQPQEIPQPKPEKTPVEPAPEAETHLALGTAHLQAGRHDQAIVELQRAAADDPQDVRVFSRLGTAFWRAGQPQQAVEAFSQALALDPDPTDFVNRGLAYLDQGQLDNASADFGEAIQLDPNHAAAYFHRADALLSQQNFAEAVLDLNQAIKLAPESSDVGFDLAFAYIFRGSALLQLSQFAEAAADLDRAITELDPLDAADVYLLRAECHQRLDQPILARYDQELARLLGHLQEDSTDVAALREAAMLLAACPAAEIRNGRQAIGLARQACDASSGKDAACLDALAAAHAEVGEFAEAVRFAEQAVQGAGEEAARSQYLSRLERYQSGQPYRLPDDALGQP